MYLKGKAMFDEEHLQIRANLLGLLFYGVAYGFVLQPACVWGYISEICNLKKSWGTK
jgi:biofilm PGA synthesis N-glycosyltransferase PgaC